MGVAIAVCMGAGLWSAQSTGTEETVQGHTAVKIHIGNDVVLMSVHFFASLHIFEKKLR